MSKAFAALLARRFAPLDFSSVPGFPHPVPNMSEWGDFLPIFKESKEDNPAEHLLKFHECMDLLDLPHEDVRMKMFMFSLYGDARQWYFSLPPSSISSLKDFHKAFTKHCKRYFSDELAFDNCCDEYELHCKLEEVNLKRASPHNMPQPVNDLQGIVFSHQNELQMDYKETERSLSILKSDCHELEETVSLATQREDHKCIHDVVNDSSEEYVAIGDIHHCNSDVGNLREDNHSIDAFDIVSNASTYLGCHKDDVVPFENPKRDDQKCMPAVVNNLHEEYVAEVDTIHHDREISNPHHDNHSDAFVIASNASLDLCCHEEEIVPIENLKSEEQILIFASDSFRSAEIEEDSLQFSDLQRLSNLQLNHDPECVDDVAAYVMSSPHLLDLLKKTDCSRHLQERQQEGSDQKFSSYFPPAVIKQSIFSSEFCGGNEEQLQHSQLQQQLKQVFFHDFEDPIADLLDYISSVDVKIFLSEGNCLYHLLQLLFCMIWPSLLFGSRSIIMTENQFLTWLHWKHAFT
jgi:hypothetical protein